MRPHPQYNTNQYISQKHQFQTLALPAEEQRQAARGLKEFTRVMRSRAPSEALRPSRYSKI